ncbi:MAG: VOC family protein [Puniceicoccaceae bacterium]|nr:MAG: VOC family protein [Puniceicoccaceae bacterium]
MSTKHQPDGYHTITPYLNVKDAPGFIAFTRKVFDADLVEEIKTRDGSIMHAEIRIGDSIIMISEACAERGPLPASLYLYVRDADTVFRRAVDTGCKPMMEPADMFWGDRWGAVIDAWNNQWSISTHIEDVPPEELPQRAKAFAEQMAAHQGG